MLVTNLVTSNGVINDFGSIPETGGKRICKETGEAVGVPTSNVSMWRRGKQRPPADKCKLIEQATLGAVTRKELRPDIFD